MFATNCHLAQLVGLSLGRKAGFRAFYSSNPEGYIFFSKFLSFPFSFRVRFRVKFRLLVSSGVEPKKLFPSPSRTRSYWEM